METINIKHGISANLQASEAYQTLRREIQSRGSGLQILGVTSCNQEEGKSVVALNLAISMAGMGKKIILVDTDMRKAVLSKKVIGDKPEKGLSNYLATINSVDEIIYQTDFENFNILLSGTISPNFLELPYKEKISVLIKELAVTYDYVLLDIPPLDAAPEEAEVTKVCDGMILVVKANAVSYELGRKSKKKLELSECPILGAVMLGGA